MPAMTRALFVLFLLLAAGLPTPPAAGATAPSVENLTNGSFEGAPTRANGFVLDYDGAAPGAVAHSGQQSIDLARAGAAPQPWFALGRVRAYPVSAVPLSLVTAFNFQWQLPVAPADGRAISLEVVLEVSTLGNGVSDECFIAQFPVTAGAAWTLQDAGPAASYQTGGTACGPSGAPRSLANLQADATYAQATILDVWIQTLVSTPDPWPPGASLYVDDASLLAAHSDRARIRDAADNLCGGASFADIPSALACAANNATILLSPVTFTGALVIQQSVTLCAATSAASTDCAPDSAGATLNGDGINPGVIDIQAPDVTIRGITIQNPAYSGSANAVLVDIHADRATLENNLIVAPAAAPAPSATRAQTAGVMVRDGAANATLRSNSIFAFPAPAGAAANCACRSIGILVAGGAGFRANSNTIDLSGAGPATGILIATGDGMIGPGSVSIDGASIGILAQPGTSPTLYGNNVDKGRNDATGSIGISVQTATATLTNNGIDGMDIGVRLDPVGAIISGSYFGRDKIDVLLVSGTGVQRLDAHHTDGKATAISLLAATHDVRVDARGANWGVYARTAIQALMSDAGARNVIDFSCYLDADGVTRICPPTAAFTTQPGAPTWNRNVAFQDASASGGRPLNAWSYSFGDGANAAGPTPNHVYAAPGVYAVTLNVTDSEGWSNQITRNVPVADTAPVFDAIPPATIGENESLVIRVRAVDAEGDPVTYSSGPLPPRASFDAANATLSWQPNFTQEGSYDITLRASDGALVSTTTMRVVVQHRNAPPMLAINGSLRATENALATLEISATDEDHDAILTSASPLILGMTYADHGNGTGTFSWTPAATDAGDYPLTFQASDGVNVTSVNVVLHVTDVNRPPYISTPTGVQTIREASNALLSVLCADPDGDPCTITGAQLPSGAKYDASRSLFEWTPTYTQAGWYNATFRLSDPTVTVILPLTIRVLNTDRPPHINAIQDQTTLTSRTLVVPLTTSDPDGDPISYSSPDAPPGVSFTPAGMVYRPPMGGEGQYQFHVVASDGQLTDRTTVNATVGVNHPPVLALTGPNRVDVFQRFVLSAYGSYDPDGTTLTYSWDYNETDGLAGDSRDMNVTTSYLTVANRTVTLTVTDADGLSTVAKLPITVDDTLIMVLNVFRAGQSGDGVIALITVYDWRMHPVPNAHVVVRKIFRPSPFADPLFPMDAEGATGATGIAYFRFPADTPYSDLPGTHIVTATASIPTSYLGDPEAVTVETSYNGLL